ncbi:hypothetical protein quinque_008972 [Culex quinquefasciatus]
MSDAKKTEPKLTMAKVPMHFRTHWDSQRTPSASSCGCRPTHKSSRWRDNFCSGSETTRRRLNRRIDPESFIKESESVYTLWCSGRTCCEGMLVELKMIKRQDLVSLIAGIMKPVQDQLHIKVEMSPDAMDNFVFCVATRKQAAKMFKKKMGDLIQVLHS